MNWDRRSKLDRAQKSEAQKSGKTFDRKDQEFHIEKERIPDPAPGE